MPRSTLTLDQVVSAAIDLLDADGLDGLNMRSLGGRLGSAATAVYWHVKSKDALVRLAGDAIWAEVGLPDLAVLDWRSAAAELATGLHATMLRHPWLVQAMASHLVHGPGKTRYDDHTLAVFERAGIVGEDAARAAAVIFMFVLGNAVGPAAAVSLTRRLGRDAAESLRAAVACVPDKAFELGLAVLLDGFDAMRGQIGGGR